MRFFLVLLVTLIVTPAHAKKVNITLLQVSNLSEITAENGGETGGVARVATVLQELRKENKNTFSFLAGGLFKASAIGTAVVGGEPIEGQQTVAILNAMQWDYAALGSREFFKSRDGLLARIAQAKFKIVTSNTLDSTTGKLIENTLATDIFSVSGVTVGVASISSFSSTNGFITVQNAFASAEQAVRQLKEEKKADIVLLITDQSLGADIEFASQLQGVDLIIGGGEFENILVRKGRNFTPIAKADPNARSVYIHLLSFDTIDKSLIVASQLKELSSLVKEDSKVKKVVGMWVRRAFKGLKDDGYDPEKVVTITSDVLDGTTARIFNDATMLTQLVGSSGLNALPNTDVSIINAGYIGLSGEIPSGPLSQYDIIRILPMGGSFELLSVPGDILEKVLNSGLSKKGSAEFLHTTNAALRNNQWFIKSKSLDRHHDYKVSIPRELFNHGNSALELLVDSVRVKNITPYEVSTRSALIAELKKVYPSIAVLRRENSQYLAQF